MMVPWTDERVARLKAMWHAGKSGAQIAAELGNVTRSAVIAKINRPGLSGSGRANSGLVEARRKARPKAGKPASPESQSPRRVCRSRQRRCRLRSMTRRSRSASAAVSTNSMGAAVIGRSAIRHAGLSSAVRPVARLMRIAPRTCGARMPRRHRSNSAA